MYLKNEYRNRWRNVESDLRIQLPEIKPNIEKLVAECSINLPIKINFLFIFSFVNYIKYFVICVLFVYFLFIVLRFKS
jgi:hypothetical protein